MVEKIDTNGSTIDVNFLDEKSVIKVIGVGGGGGNAVNYMFRQGICNVDFVICNTDRYALNKSPIPIKIQLGEKGLGAGNKPEVGRQAAIESLPRIEQMLEGTEMVFITAGMGGGTGTGAAPVIAEVAKKAGILTIGIVTIPFLFEGNVRVVQAIEGVEEMRKHVDAILVICNERIKKLHGDLTLSNAFSKADNVLTMAAKGIAEIITIPGYVNVDLNDVRTVMSNSGDAIMGSGMSAGVNRAIEAISKSLDSPLLLSTDIRGAKNILLNISYGVEEVTMDEVDMITAYLRKEIGQDAQIIWGATPDDSLGEEVSITIVATGFNINRDEISSQAGVRPQEPPPPPPPPVKKPVDLNAYYGFSEKENATFQATVRNNPVQQQGTPYQQQELEEDDSIIILDTDDDARLDRFENEPAYRRKSRYGNSSNTNRDSFMSDNTSRFSIRDDTGFTLRDQNDYLHNNAD
jgi:cell division protein FtsZ